MRIVDLNLPQDSGLPVIPVTNISVTGVTLQLIGSMYWIEKGNKITVTADVALPNGEMMAIIEQVVRSTMPVDEIRRPVTIASGRLTLEFTPSATRVHTITAERLNAGLAEVGAQFRLSFPSLEFDVYAPV